LVRPVFAGIAALVFGCGAPVTSPEPTPDPWTPPSDWVMVSTVEGTMSLTLPPWLQAFDNHGSIFAAEPPPAPGAAIPMQLMVHGPGVDDGLRSGENVLSWIERRLEEPGRGVPTVTRVTLPAGPATRYERLDMVGTTYAWRFLVFVVETPRGLAWVQFDGPPGSWPTRTEDLGHVVSTFRIS
jgi:hypothetical protein